MMRRHVLPNIVAPLTVLTTVYFSQAILAEATLSFLGLGTQPPEAAWGNMLATARPTSTRTCGCRSGRAPRSCSSCSASTSSATASATSSTRASAAPSRPRGLQARDADSHLRADLLVRDGLIVDGSGEPPFRGDVAVEGGTSPPSATSTANGADRVIEARGRVVCPGFVDPHSHSDFTLLTNPTAQSDDPPGRHDRGRRQLRLTYAPVSDASRSFDRGAAADVRLRRPGRVGELRRPPLVPLGRRPLAEPRLVRRPQHPPPRRRRFAPQATEEQLSRWSATSPRRWTQARSASRPGSSSTPGAPRRPTDRPPEQGRRPLRRLLHEPRPQPRRAPAGLDRGVPADHPRGRHEGRDLALRRAQPHRRRAGRWQRAVDTMQEAREVEGLDVLADTTPFRDGLGQMAGILPPWVLADGWEEALKRLRDPAVTRAAAGRLRPLLALHPPGRLAPRAPAGEPAVPGARGQDFRSTIAARRWGSTRWDCYFEILADAGPGIESLLLIGELFTDEHLAEMISHPLFSLGVDGYTAPLDAGLDAVVGHPVCFAGHVHYLRTTSASGDAAARGGDPQDDVDAGAALRPADRGALGRAWRRIWSCSTWSASRTARRSSIRSTTSGRRRGARQRRRGRRGRRAHGRPARAAPRRAT